MGLGGCFNCIKYMMFAFNFLFWLLGCALLAVSIWILVDPNFRDHFSGVDSSFVELLYKGAYVFVAIGAIIMVLGFLGCCGALRESQCMLATFFVFLILIFVVLVGAGIWAAINKDKLRDEINAGLEEKVKNFKGNATGSEELDNIQKSFECCGASRGVTDYPVALQAQAREFCEAKNHDKPCTDAIFEVQSGHMVIIVGVAIGIGVVMLLGIVFSMMLCCAIREATA